jgi:hypothetical protein
VAPFPGHDQALLQRAAAPELDERAETDRLLALLESNTTLTAQDEELTEQVARLTREVHARLAPGAPSQGS